MHTICNCDCLLDSTLVRMISCHVLRLSAPRFPRFFSCTPFPTSHCVLCSIALNPSPEYQFSMHCWANNVAFISVYYNCLEKCCSKASALSEDAHNIEDECSLLWWALRMPDMRTMTINLIWKSILTANAKINVIYTSMFMSSIRN